MFSLPTKKEAATARELVQVCFAWHDSQISDASGIHLLQFQGEASFLWA
jgi:hypothetical protein